MDQPNEENLLNQADEPAEKIMVTRKNGENCEYTFMTCVNSNEELDDLRFEHNCDSLLKQRPNFGSITLHCKYISRKQKCQFSLFARRLDGNRNRIKVYAHGEHNHTIQPIEKRSAYRLERGLVLNDELPEDEIQIGTRKWTFQKIVGNFQQLNQIRQENHCTTNGIYWKAEAMQMMLQCSRGVKCPFRMLVRKTTEDRYQVYTFEEHNHPLVLDHRRREGNELQLDEQDSQFTVQNIGYGLKKALFERNGQEMDKWVERTGKEQIEEVLTGMDGKEMVLLLTFFEQASREEDLSSGLQGWLDWINIAIENRGAELIENLEMTDRLIGFSQWLNSIQLPNDGIEEGVEEFPIDKIQRRIEKAIRKANEGKVRKWMARTGKEQQIETLLGGMDEQNRGVVFFILIGAIGDNEVENGWTLAWIGAILGSGRLRKMIGPERESSLWNWLNGQEGTEAVLLRAKLNLDKLVKKAQKKRKIDEDAESEIAKKKMRKED